MIEEAKADGHTIGFVPTMGALHRGHTALIDASVKRCDFTVVSIYVNPLQFGPSEDLKQYPRDLKADTILCERHGANLVFAPDDEEMYPTDQQLTVVEVQGLTDHLCGASRPGHFKGVTTVVAKLFQIITSDFAFFGEKDFQQLAVIRRMVEDLHFPVKIMPVATVREEDGLALSSRNRYLSGEERSAASAIPTALSKARHVIQSGERNPKTIKQVIRDELALEPMIREDYVEIVDEATLHPINYIDEERHHDHNGRQNFVIALAVFIGNTRLIDNMSFSIGG